jgi:hypothetical protein
MAVNSNKIFLPVSNPVSRVVHFKKAKVGHFWRAPKRWAYFIGADSAFFFGTATGDIGLTLLRVPVAGGGGTPGSCSTVSLDIRGHAKAAK